MKERLVLTISHEGMDGDDVRRILERISPYKVTEGNFLFYDDITGDPYVVDCKMAIAKYGS